MVKHRSHLKNSNISRGIGEEKLNKVAKEERVRKRNLPGFVYLLIIRTHLSLQAQIYISVYTHTHSHTIVYILFL